VIRIADHAGQFHSPFRLRALFLVQKSRRSSMPCSPPLIALVTPWRSLASESELICHTASIQFTLAVRREHCSPERGEQRHRECL
jgi:hypothetical protein